MGTVTLFHYTSMLHAPLILRDGLAKGDVPTSPDTGFNGVWFTLDENPARQTWSSGTRMIMNGQVMPLDKTRVRVRVTFDKKDPALFNWGILAQRIGIDHEYFRWLNISGGGDGDTWFVFLGKIPASRFDGVDFWNEYEWVPLDPAWLPRAPVVQVSMAELLGEKVEKQPVPWYLLGGNHAA